MLKKIILLVKIILLLKIKILILIIIKNKKDSTKTEETSSIEDVIYPMYLPSNTHLSNKEKVTKESGERLILTFDGDNPFMLIEETIAKRKKNI